MENVELNYEEIQGILEVAKEKAVEIKLERQSQEENEEHSEVLFLTDKLLSSEIIKEEEMKDFIRIITENSKKYIEEAKRMKKICDTILTDKNETKKNKERIVKENQFADDLMILSLIFKVEKAKKREIENYREKDGSSMSDEERGIVINNASWRATGTPSILRKQLYDVTGSILGHMSLINNGRIMKETTNDGDCR